MSTAVCSSGTCGVKPCSKEAIPDALASGKVMVLSLWSWFLHVKSYSFWYYDFLLLKFTLLFKDHERLSG